MNKQTNLQTSKLNKKYTLQHFEKVIKYISQHLYFCNLCARNEKMNKFLIISAAGIWFQTMHYWMYLFPAQPSGDSGHSFEIFIDSNLMDVII